MILQFNRLKDPICTDMERSTTYLKRQKDTKKYTKCGSLYVCYFKQVCVCVEKHWKLKLWRELVIFSKYFRVGWKETFTISVFYTFLHYLYN